MKIKTYEKHVVSLVAKRDRTFHVKNSQTKSYATCVAFAPRQLPTFKPIRCFYTISAI